MVRKYSVAVVMVTIVALLCSGLPQFAQVARVTTLPPPLGCTGPGGAAAGGAARPTAFEKLVDPAVAGLATLAHDGAELAINPGAVPAKTTFGITPLAAADLPKLDGDLENVTAGPRRGYRFTPHPYTFRQKIRVTLPYDAAAVGTATENLFTFYFDDQRGCWRPLERVEVDKTRQVVVSLTDHFTDMINGTVVVPEHPEGQSFNPTQIKDITAADPGSKVNMIGAPGPNSMGDNRLSYPIEVPPGRGGIQPQLSVRYSSSGGNGWMGVGWDLAVPSITIDTRWGVPRYDAGLETETYLLNGQQLTPVAHRGELQPRTAEKVFHSRVEGEFRRIVRHGGNPAAYSWEVTDKSGTKSLYGGSPESTLTDATTGGNIFVWALREVHDPHGNLMRFHSARVDDSGVGDGTGTAVPGRNLYLDRITYTGQGTSEGHYQVRFIRGSERRADVVIDARGGFKRVTAHVLKQVEVLLDDQLIRRYEFGYREGAFFKTLLQSVTQVGEDGNVFNKHEFEYFDEVRDDQGNYQPFEEAKAWQVGSDGLENPALLGKGAASVLGSNTSGGFGGHGYVGIGTDPSKSNSVGVKVGFSRGDGDGLVALVDVNGDDLADKVFRKNGKTFYRKNLSGPAGATAFSATPVEISLPAISSERTDSTTTGIEGYPGGIAAQLDFVDTFTRTDRYLHDVNGDGISDLVAGRGVLFGHLDAQGNPVYSTDSADTPVPVGSGTVNGSILGDFGEELERRLDTFPLLDGVRRWVAPYSGVVTVAGDVRLIENSSTKRPKAPTADGVRVAIQREDAELWSARIPALDFGPRTPAGVSNIPVSKGDRLYFRVQSVRDGNDDQVSWDPRITYAAISGTDVNGLPNGQYKASSDFTVGGRSTQITAPANGTLHLSGNLEKIASTTDDVTVIITRNDTEVFSQTLAHGSTGTIAVDQDIEVSRNDILRWRIRVDSPIDLQQVQWRPRAHYTSAEGVEQVVDSDGNPLLVVDPPFDIDMYPTDTTTSPQGAFTAPQSGTMTVDQTLSFQFVDGQPAPDEQITATVKRRGELVAKQRLTMVDGAVTTVRFSAAVTAGDQLFFDFSALNPRLRKALVGQSARVSFDGTNFTDVPSAFHGTIDTGAFPQPYRGWGGIGYNGNDRTEDPIIQNDLVVDENYGDQLPDGVPAPGSPEREAFENDPRIDAPKVFPFGPVPHHSFWNRALWIGSDDSTWVAADSVSSSRLGTDTVDLPGSGDINGAIAVPRLARSGQTSASLGVGPVGLSQATGGSTGELDFVDLNGDRFPDAVGAQKVQFSELAGGLGSRLESFDGIRSSDNTARNGQVNVTASAGSPARTETNGQGHAGPTGTDSADTAKSGSQMPSLGLGGNVGGGDSTGQFDLLDINGDGLPDRVFANGEVALNLGYRFAARETWGGGTLNETSTGNLGVNLGANIDFYGFATGASLSSGTSAGSASLADLNGDGLLDRVFTGAGPLEVSLNTGNGFKPRTPWRLGTPDNHTDLSGINRDVNTSLGAGVYFTFSFCIAFVAACVIVNPGGDTSAGQSRQELVLRDINGDGYADRLSSTNDGELVVAENHTDRTNLLRTVRRPLGASLEFDYTRDGNTADLPQSRWVLSRTTVHDGHPGDGVDAQLSTYRYEGGFYDRLEREFYGYRTVIAEQRDAGAVLRTSTSEYHNDSYYRQGLPRVLVTRDAGGHKFTESANTYELRDTATGTPGDGKSTTATIFPRLVRTDKRFFEGQAQAGKSTFTELDHDAFGNVSRTVDHADAGSTDDVETLIGYSTECSANNIVGVPKSIEVRGAGVLMRQRSSNVDCATGNVTRHKAFLADGSEAVTDLTYFANGNIETVTEPPNKAGQRELLRYTYDPLTETQVASVTDSFGLTSTTTYNPKYGAPETTTDTNNQVLRHTYDTVGRVDTVTSPHETGTGRVSIDFEYHPEAAVPFAITRHVDRNSDGSLKADTIDTVTFADGLQRAVQIKKDATVHSGPDTPPADVMTVSGRTVYDALGRAVEQFYPTTEPKGPGNMSFNPVADTVAPSRTTYDVLDRATRVVLPDNAVTTSAYGFGPDRAGTQQFETVVTDAEGNVSRTFTDVRELTTAIRQTNPAGGQPTIWTSYTYDPLRQVTQVTDDKNNVTGASYDNFGRRTVFDNPDEGRTRTDYDLAGNAIRKITAKLAAAGKSVEYDYEFNRLKTIRYPLFTDNNVSYTYGAPGAANNGAGRVIVVSDAAGTVTRQYGPLGELTNETRTVPGQGNHTQVFTTSYKFDTWNRVLRMTFPDGEVLSYHYNSGGSVDGATGVKGGNTYRYLTRLDYDKFEQRMLLGTGNGTVTKFSYNADDRRLATLESKLAQGYVFQNLNYDYDKVGNVTSLNNETQPPDGPDVGQQVGGPSQQSFVYDDLYRLTHAEGTYTSRGPKTDKYRLDIGYDSIHNTTSKNQFHELVTNGNSVTQHKTTYNNGYAYNSGRPHAPSVVGPETMRYDVNGNLISRAQQPKPRRQQIWDEDNRLACTHENVQNKELPQDPTSCDNPGGAPDVRFAYDDRGNRVVKDSSQTHIYPNQNFSTQGNQQFKHVFIGDTRLVTKFVEPDNRLEDRQFYAHADHLGSTGFVTNTEGDLSEHLNYFPGGETWVSEHPNQPVPHQYTGKELDPETGYYNYGARYYDPRANLWQSADPALAGYLDGAPNGGIHNPANLAAYTYAYNNPLRFNDPSGLNPNETTVRINIIDQRAGIHDLKEIESTVRGHFRSMDVDPDINVEVNAVDEGVARAVAAFGGTDYKPGWDKNPNTFDVYIIDDISQREASALLKKYSRTNYRAADVTRALYGTAQGVAFPEGPRARGLAILRPRAHTNNASISNDVAHEVGHLMGLHDNRTNPASIMYFQSSNSPNRSFLLGDLGQMERRYGGARNGVYSYEPPAARPRQNRQLGAACCGP